MTFDDLPLVQQKAWDEIARVHQRMFQIMEQMKKDGCFECGYQYDRFPELMAHAQQTHGLPREFWEVAFNKAMI